MADDDKQLLNMIAEYAKAEGVTTKQAVVEIIQKLRKSAEEGV